MIVLSVGLNFISFVYQQMSNYIYLQTYMIYKTGFRRKSVDLFESVSHCRLSPWNCKIVTSSWLFIFSWGILNFEFGINPLHLMILQLMNEICVQHRSLVLCAVWSSLTLHCFVDVSIKAHFISGRRRRPVAKSSGFTGRSLVRTPTLPSDDWKLSLSIQP